MDMIHAFAMASAAYSYIERGVGHAIIAPGDKFFCGFEQDDGSVVYAPFRQEPNPGGKPTISKFAADEYLYSTDKPVFLSTAEMEEKGLGAAAFGQRMLAINDNDLPKEIAKECQVATVRKDLTFKQENIKIDIFEGPPSQAGIASPKACEAADERVYVSLRKEFREQVKQVKAAISSLFKPSGPS